MNAKTNEARDAGSLAGSAYHAAQQAMSIGGLVEELDRRLLGIRAEATDGPVKDQGGPTSGDARESVLDTLNFTCSANDHIIKRLQELLERV